MLAELLKVKALDVSARAQGGLAALPAGDAVFLPLQSPARGPGQMCLPPSSSLIEGFPSPSNKLHTALPSPRGVPSRLRPDKGAEEHQQLALFPEGLAVSQALHSKIISLHPTDPQSFAVYSQCFALCELSDTETISVNHLLSYCHTKSVPWCLACIWML